ncbi:MAG: hypothetical protein AVDCRST_MAG56-6184 [uncultured Cytophagales bacterium]|uniref:SusE outer membrane protein domain-containing protein n=1 Tax=uncultured Cytophagales bacterium TaxID=158755 RepID=A0A6J4KM13_9SPHI|nr:MAG: hypothetical protein AVDCRST_MAG56-6184 [uncultured Cytophagales bacterium]
MNISLNRLVVLSLFALAFFACEKDEDRVVMQQGTPPALTASTATLVLDRSNAGADALTFSATPSNYGFNAAVTYTLELAKKGNNFSDSVTVALGNTREKKFSVGELNGILNRLELPAASMSEVEARVKSQVAPSVAPVYSNVVTIAATPYADLVDYPSIYVPGSYQAWSPDKAPRISSVSDNKMYEGYVNFPDATTEFKFTTAPNWNENFGDATTGTSKTLKANGENIKVTGPGYYLVKADLNALTWSVEKTSWGVIGDATPAGWTNDTDLTYDAATGTWKITLDLKSTGKMKFRANDKWDINMGDLKTPNGFLAYGGEDIPVPVDGRYDITLDLSVPGNYRYTLKKL